MPSPVEALAVRLEHRATQNAIVRSYGIMPSSRPEDDEMDREAAATLREQAERLDIQTALATNYAGKAVEYKQEKERAEEQLDTLRNAIEPALDALRGWDMLGPGGTGDREWALGQLDRIAGALAAAGGGVPEEGATDE